MMTTTPEMLTRLVRDRQDELMAEAEQARLVRATRSTARERRRRAAATAAWRPTPVAEC